MVLPSGVSGDGAGQAPDPDIDSPLETLVDGPLGQRHWGTIGSFVAFLLAGVVVSSVVATRAFRFYQHSISSGRRARSTR